MHDMWRQISFQLTPEENVRLYFRRYIEKRIYAGCCIWPLGFLSYFNKTLATFTVCKKERERVKRKSNGRKLLGNVTFFSCRLCLFESVVCTACDTKCLMSCRGKVLFRFFEIYGLSNLNHNSKFPYNFYVKRTLPRIWEM